MCKPRNNHRIKIPLVFLFIFVQLSFAFSQQDNLEVKGKIEADSLRIAGGTELPKTPVKGEVFYRTDENKYYAFDGQQWQMLSGGSDRYVATKVVAAYNSLGSTVDGSAPIGNPCTNCCTGDGTACINPKADYTCTGSYDENTIQAAINALGSNPGVVYLLEGTYNIKSIPIRFVSSSRNDSGKAIIGTGKGTVLKAVLPLNGVIEADTVDNILITNLTIDGGNYDSFSVKGIRFLNVSNSKIAKVYIKNYGGNTKLISLEDGSINNVVSENMLYTITNSAAIYSSSFNNSKNIFTKNIITGAGIGFSLTSSKDLLILDNVIQGVGAGLGSGGIIAYMVSDSVFCRNSIQGLIIGMAFNSSNNNVICENNIDSNLDGGMFLEDSSYNLISGNNITKNGNYSDAENQGIRLKSSGKYNVITGNVIYDNGLNNQAQITFSSSFSPISDNLISFNTISDTNGSNGISIDCPFSPLECGNNYLSGNNIIGWPTNYLSDISDQSPNIYTDRKKITLEPGGYTNLANNQTLTFFSPTSYLKLNPSGEDIVLGTSTTEAIQDGKSRGDLLILENVSTTPVQVNNWLQNPNNVFLNTSSVTLGQHDTLTLIWDGWIWNEVSRCIR